MFEEYEDFIAFAEEAISMADGETEKALKEGIYENIDFLKNISNKFLKTIENTWIKIQLIDINAKNIYKIKSALKKNSISQELTEALEFQKALKIKDEEFKVFSQAIFLYQAAVNAVLGQSVELIYVYQDENGQPEVWHVKEDGNSSIVSQTLASKGRGLVGKYKSLSAMDAHKTQLKASAGTEKQGFDTLKETYVEVHKRADISKEKTKRLYIMWLTNKWHVMQVSAKGDINEAYAAFFLNMIYRENFIFPDSAHNIGQEYHVEYFMTDEQYGIKAVDSVSGLLQGDISIQLSNGLSLEFAAKSKDASALGFSQVINLATAIVTGDNGITKEEITMEWLRSYKEGLTFTSFKNRNKKIQGRNKEKRMSDLMRTTANRELKDLVASRINTISI